MKKNYKYQNVWDFANCIIRDKDQNTVHQVPESMCYSFISRLSEAKNNKDFKWFTTYLIDAWSPSCFYMKAFMLAMDSLNLFRNVHECKIVLLDAVPPAIKNTIQSRANVYQKRDGYVIKPPTHALKLEFDLEKISVVEMFMIINIMRTMQLYPSAVESMFKLHALHPDVDYFKCLLVSHSLDFSKQVKDAKMGEARNSNHLIAYYGFANVVASIPEAHKHIDTNFTSPAKIDWSYRRVVWNEFFTKTVNVYDRNKGGEELRVYSKKVFDTFFDMDLYNKVFSNLDKQRSTW